MDVEVKTPAAEEVVTIEEVLAYLGAPDDPNGRIDQLRAVVTEKVAEKVGGGAILRQEYVERVWAQSGEVAVTRRPVERASWSVTREGEDVSHLFQLGDAAAGLFHLSGIRQATRFGRFAGFISPTEGVEFEFTYWAGYVKEVAGQYPLPQRIVEAILLNVGYRLKRPANRPTEGRRKGAPAEMARPQFLHPDTTDLLAGI